MVLEPVNQGKLTEKLKISESIQFCSIFNMINLDDSEEVSRNMSWQQILQEHLVDPLHCINSFLLPLQPLSPDPLHSQYFKLILYCMATSHILPGNTFLVSVKQEEQDDDWEDKENIV